MKILILKPSSLGDVIHALPVLRMLRRALPDAEIDWWIDASLLALLEQDPDLTQTIAFHRRRWSHPRYWPEALQSLRHLRSRRYDWVIDLQALARSSLVAWLCHARLTVGLDDPREGAPAFYDLRVPRPSYHAHAVDWYLATLDALRIPLRWDFDWLPPRPAVARHVREQWPDPQPTWITLLPGARWINKRWPATAFAELVDLLAADQPKLRFAILGSSADRPLATLITQRHPHRCLDLTGLTSLPEMIEWIRASRLTVSNDTGPLHVAAAVGTPVVAVFGPTEPRRTGPYHQRAHVLQASVPCVPCLKHQCHHPQPLACLHQITPQTVFAAAQRHLLSSPVA